MINKFKQSSEEDLNSLFPQEVEDNLPLEQASEEEVLSLFTDNIPVTSTSTGYDTLGKYDKGLVYGQDQGINRATNQPWSHQAANAVLGGVASGLATFVEDASYILDFDNNIKRLQGIETVEQNWLGQKMKDLKENINQDWLPIYRRNPGEVFDWSDSGFYWEALKGILDSAVGFGLTGLGAGAAARGVGTLLGKGMRAARLGAWVDNMSQFSKAATTFGGAYTMNFGEGKMMALELFENSKQELMSQGLSERRAAELAGEQADNFMLWNKAMIASDAFAMAGIAKVSRRGANLLKEKNLQTFAKNFTKFNRTNPLAQATAEGLEEIYQNTVQKEKEYQASKQAGVEDGKISNDLFGRLVGFATSDQALLEGMMGFFGGPVQYGIIQHPFTMADRGAYQDQYQRQQEQIKENEAFLTSKFKDIIDTQERINDAVSKGETEVAEIEEEELFTRVVADNYERGTIEVLERQLQEIVDDPNGEEKYGEGYKEKAKQKLEKLSKVEDEINKLYNKYPNPIFERVVPTIYKLQERKKLLSRQKAENEINKGTLQEQYTDEINKSRTEVINSGVVQLEALSQKKTALEKTLDKVESQKRNTQQRNKRIVEGLTGRKTPTNKTTMLTNRTRKQIDRIDQEMQALEASLKAQEDNERIKIDNSELGQQLTESIFKDALFDSLIEDTQEKLDTFTNAEKLEEFVKEQEAEIKKDVEEKKERAKEEAAKKKRAERNKGKQQQKEPTEQAEDELKDTKTAEEERMRKEQEALSKLSDQEVSGMSEAALLGKSVNLGNKKDETKPKKPAKKEVSSEEQHNPTQYTDLTDKEVREEIRRLAEKLAEENREKVPSRKEEDEEERKDYNKLPWSYRALAYVSKSSIKTVYNTKDEVVVLYTEKDNELSPELRDQALLDGDEYGPGTKVTFVVDKDYVLGEGENQETYDTLLELGKSRGEENQYDYIPIAVQNSKGVTIGYLHDVDFPITHTWHENVETDIATIRSIRKALAARGRYETTIIEKTPGHLMVEKNGNSMKLSEATEEEKPTIAVLTGNGILSNNGELEAALDLRPGFPYLVTASNNGSPLAIPLRSTKLSDEHKQSIINAFKAHLRGKRVGDLNLDIPNKLLEYLRNFASDTVPQENFDRKLENYLAEQSDAVAGINIVGESIDIGIGGGISFVTTRINKADNQYGKKGERIYIRKDGDIPVPINEGDFLETLSEALDRMYYHTNVGMLTKEGSFNLPLINDEFETTNSEFTSYTDFLKDVYESNILGRALDNGRVVYSVQPTIYMDVEELIRAGEEVERATIGVQPDTKAESQPVKIEGTDVDLGIVLDSSKPVDDSSGIVKSLTKQYYKDNLEGLTPLQQENLVTSLSSHIFRKTIIAKEKTSLREALNGVKNFLQIVQGKLEGVGNTQMAANVGNLLLPKQWAKLEALLVRRVQQVQGINLFEENLDNFDGEGYNEKLDYSKSSLEIDPKTTASVRLRHFLSTIKDVDSEGNIATNNTYIRVERFVPYEKAFRDIKMILTNTEPSYNAMVQALKDDVSKRPYLKQVIEKLAASTSDVQNEFVSQMATHPTEMITIIVDDKGKKGTVGKIISTNRRSNSQVVLDEWENNLISSNLIEVDERGAYIPEDKAVALAKEYNTLKTPEEYHEWLGKLGVELNFNLVKSLVNSKGFNKYVKNKASGMFGVLADNLGKRKNNTFEESPLLGQTALRRLASYESRYRGDVYSSSYMNGERKTIATYAQNKYFIDRIRRLNENNEGLIDALLALPYNKTSKWLQLLKDENSNMRDNFSYFYIDTMKLPGNRRGTTFENLNEIDLETAKLNLFFNMGNVSTRKDKQGNERYARFVHPTTSDKNEVVGVQTIAHDTEREYGEGTINAVYEALVLSEINRIIEFQNKETNISGFEEGSKMFLHMPELNRSKGKFKSDFDSLWEGDKLKPLDQLQEEGEIDKIKTYIRDKYLPELVRRRVARWNELGIFNSKTGEYYNLDSKYIDLVSKDRLGTKTSSEELANYLALDYEVNYLIANANYFQTLIGDPAFFFKGKENLTPIENGISTFNNIGKRLAREIAPGTALANSWGEEFRVGLVSDRSAPSINKELRQMEFEGKRPYESINSTDAQELTTVEEHLKILHGLGRITKEQVKDLTKKAKNETLTSADLDKMLQPLKPVYSDNIMDKTFKTERPVYIKSSSFPLVPQLTRGLELDKLRKAMESKNGVARVAFSTAVKVGNTANTLEIYNADGTIKDNIKFGKDNTIVLNRRGHRIQQDIPLDPTKTEIVDGTQQLKLLFDSIMHIEGMPELEQQFRENYQEWYDIRREFIQRSFTKEDGSLDVAQIQDKLKKEALRRGYNLNDLELLDLGEQDFLKYIFFTESSSRMEALLNSIVDKRARKTTMPGFSGVLGTEEGFRFKEKLTSKEAIRKYIRENKPGIKFTENWTGELQSNQILVPWKIFNIDGSKLDINDFIDEDGMIDTSKLPMELLKMFGYRIPTSKHSSMTMVEVAGFLPEESGDLVIASRDLVAQMGHDFDVDKLYLFGYNFLQLPNGKLVKFQHDETKAKDRFKTLAYNKLGAQNLEETEYGKQLLRDFEDSNYQDFIMTSKIKGIQNNILDIHFKVMGNKEVHDNYVIKPISYGKLPEFAEWMENKRGEDNTFSPLSEDYQRNKYLKAKSGKAGIGVFSQLSTFLARAQDRQGEENKNLYFTLKKAKLSISFGPGNSSTTISDSKLGQKTNVASIFQNVSVDNENLQVLDKINVNSYTFRVINTLVSMGFNEETIIGFINQDVIVDYIRLQDKYKNSAKFQGIDPKNLAYKELVEEYKNEQYDKKKTKDKIKDTNLIGTKEMWKMIDTKETGENRYKQLLLLDRFRMLEQVGNSLANIINSIDVDSSGIPSSLIQANLIENELSNLVDNSHVANAHRLLKDEEGNYNSVTGYATQTLALNNSLWNQIFPYEKRAVNRAYEEVISALELNQQSISDKTKLKYAISQHLKSYIYAQISDNLSEDRRRLFVDVKNKHMSLASILQQIKNNPELEVNSNALINRLVPNIDKRKNRVSTIDFDRTDRVNTVEDTLQSGFIELLGSNEVLGEFNGKELTAREFAEELALYDFISGERASTAFSRYIPLRYKMLKYSTILSKVNFDDYNLIGAAEGKDVSDFTRQWIQHNAWRVTPTSWDQVQQNESQMRKTGGLRMKATLPNDGVSPKYVTIRTKDTQIHLFERIGDKLPEYKKISTLGKFGLDEYQPNVQDAVSIFDDNAGQAVIAYEKDQSNPNSKKVPNVKKTGGKYDALSLGSNKPITEALGVIQRQDKNPFFAKLADYYLKANPAILSKYRTEIVESAIIGEDNHAQIQTGNKVIQFNKDRENGYKGLKDDELTNFLMGRVLHEVTHALTVDAINNGGKEVDAIQDLFNDYLNLANPKSNNYIHLTKEVEAEKALHEFVALVMEDESFQREANEIRIGVDKPKSLLQEIFDKLRELLATFLKIGKIHEDSIQGRAMNSILNLINNSDPNQTQAPTEPDFNMPAGAATLGKFTSNSGSSWSWARTSKNGYEVSTKGDKRFSALVAKLKDGRTIEAAYQLDIKGYRVKGNDWRLGKGKPPIKSITKEESWRQYKELWRTYLKENPTLKQDLIQKAKGKVLTDQFASTDVSQARAIAEILNEENNNQQLNLFSSNKPLEFFSSKKTDENRFDVLIQDRQLRIEDLEGAITRLKTLPNTGKRIEQLRSKIDVITLELAELESATALRDVEEYGKKDVETLKRIVSNKEISLEDIKEGRRIINLWKSNLKLLFTDFEKKTRNKIVEAFEAFKNEVEHIEDVAFNKIEIDFLQSALKDYGEEIDVIEEMTKTEDIGQLYAQVMDITRTNNGMLQAIGKIYMQRNAEARQESKKRIDKLEELIKKALPKLKALSSKGSIFDIFKQRRADGKTINNIIMPFTPEFYEKRSELRRTASETKSPKLWDNYYKWLANNTYTFDVRKLYRQQDIFEGEDIDFNKTKVTFDEGSPEIEAHIKELKDILGENEYNSLKARLDKKISEYKERYEYNKQNIWEEEKDQTVREAKLKKWVQTNSPYWHLENINASKRVTDRGITNKGYEYTYQIASKEEWLDSNFKKITADKDLQNLYDYMMDIMSETKTYLSDSQKENLTVNALPVMSKSIAEAFSTDGRQAGFNGIYDALIEASVDNSLMNYERVDEVTGEVIRKLKAGLAYDHEEVRRLYDLAVIEFEQKQGHAPNKQQKQELRRKASDQVAQDSSFDLEKIMKAMIVTTQTYRHRAGLEEPLRIAKNIINNTQEMRRDTDGNILWDEEAKPLEESFRNISTQFEAFINAFYGVKKKNEGKINKKIYTKKEKARVEKIDELLAENENQLKEEKIDQAKYEEVKKTLEDEKNKLGGYATGSQFLRNMLQFMQLKGMGWNWFAAFNNLGFGAIANYTEASAGELYNTKEITEAYGLLLHSITKNYTLEGINTETAKKIRNLMDRLDILRDASYELKKSMTVSKVRKGLRRIEPLSMQKHTEYLNQAAVMIAMMKHRKVGDKSVWDNYNSGGEWVGPGSEPKDLATAIIQMNKRNHGNYDPDSPLALKEEGWKQMLSQFRTWMFENFANRFEKEKYDRLLGVTRKGRYRSGFLFFTGAKATVDGEEMGIVSKNLYTLGQLGRKLLFMNTNFDKRFNATDAANLRRNLTETVILMSIAAFAAALKYGLEDEDDEKKKFAFYTLMNSMTRLQTDILLYVSPTDLEALIKRPVPVSSLIIDTAEWFNAVGRYVIGDDEIKSGHYAGHSRLARETAQMLPFGTQVYRTYSTGNILYNK